MLRRAVAVEMRIATFDVYTKTKQIHFKKNYLYIYGKAIQAIMNATKSKKID